MDGKDYTLQTDTEEIYAMPFFAKLLVADVGRSTEWYVEALGFRALFVMSHPSTGEPYMAHLRRGKYQDIMLVHGVCNHNRDIEGIVLTFSFGENIDAFAYGAKEAGAEVVGGPANTSWNTREVTLRDPDGYLLTFTHGPRADISFENVVESISDELDRVELPTTLIERPKGGKDGKHDA